MSEFIKQRFEKWIKIFRQRLDFETSKSGFTEDAARMAVIIELMKEQVPNEDSSHTTR